MRPPQTGVDNPAFYDDTALPGAIAVGIAAASPADAAALARLLASITHDGVGVDAAALLARLVSALLEGTDFAPALAASRAELADEPGGEPGAGGWVGDGIRDAFAVMDAAPTPFAAVPDLIARFAPRTYSHSGIVAETLPLALAIVRATGGDHERALPLAMSISRHQDSVPALVGALCGAMGSAPDVAGLDELTGILNPATTGWSLGALARRLASQGREWRG